MFGKWYTGKIVQIENAVSSGTTKRFWVEIPTLETIHFRAGQFMTFDLPVHKKRLKRWRSYSIASAPNADSNVVEFVIVRLEGGLGTGYLFDKVQIGAELKLREAQGVFTLPKTLNPDREICFICTGTGIAPFRSMLLDIKNSGIPYPKMRLIFGTRTADNILYRAEMEALTKSLEGFEYHVTLSRATDDWQGSRGYVHSIYEQHYANGRDAVFYLCGWNVMLDEARERLAALGYDKKQIIYESYG